MTNRMDLAAGEMDHERFKGTLVQQLSKVFRIHAPIIAKKIR